MMATAASDTSAMRSSFYLLLTAAAVGIGIAKIVGAENVFEPSRFAPPTASELRAAGRDAPTFAGDRPERPTRKWPTIRPEPSLMLSSNDKSRWATVRALVDEGTFVIGRRTNFTATSPPYDDRGIIFENDYQSLDKVMNPQTGEYYSSKPPLLSAIVAAEYWLLKKTLGWSIVHDRWPVMATVLITFNVLPMLAFLLMFARVVESVGETDFGRMFAFTLAAVGTFLTTFSTTLNNHAPAAFCAFFAILPYLGNRSGPREHSPVVLVWSGFFAGLAATFELPAVSLAVALLVPLVYRRPLQTLFFFLPAMLIPIAAQFAINYAALSRWLPAYSDFGGPWYNFPGSHWNKLVEVKEQGKWHPGIDFAWDPTWLYAFHLTFGHHGWFSLTPAWLVALLGMIPLAWQSRGKIGQILARKWPSNEVIFDRSVFATMTTIISLAVLSFYLFKSNNYGGNTSGPRWLFWLIPLWLVCLIPGADRIGRRGAGRVVAAILLGISVMSVFYPAWNPWRPPWIMMMNERLGWQNYDLPPESTSALPSK